MHLTFGVTKCVRCRAHSLPLPLYCILSGHPQPSFSCSHFGGSIGVRFPWLAPTAVFPHVSLLSLSNAWAQCDSQQRANKPVTRAFLSSNMITVQFLVLLSFYSLCVFVPPMHANTRSSCIAWTCGCVDDATKAPFQQTVPPFCV